MSSVRGRRISILFEACRLAFDVIRAHKLRSALVILGVAIGVTVLSGMAAILTGLGGRIEHEATATEKPVVTLSKFDFMTTTPDDERILGRPDILPVDARALADECASVEVADFFIDATVESGQTLRYRDQKTRMVFIAGGGPSFTYVYSFAMAEGRYLNDAELLRGARVVVLGSGPAGALFPQVDPIGKEIRVGEAHYTVVGVFAERKSIFGGMSENFAIVPWTTFKKDFGRKNDPYYVYLTVASGYGTEDVVQEARMVMRRRHGLKLAEDDDFVLIENDQITEFIRRYTGPIGLVLLVLSSIGLTVGGIGVMNIMLVSVVERTQEIGIRKAVGARRRVILAQFLVEAGTLTGIGGAVGVVLGGGAAFAIGKLAGFPSAIDPLVILGGLGFSVGIGLFFGIYPAARAARLDPIEALRFEY